jgi:deoxyribodipyrimidine photo-lyase
MPGVTVHPPGELNKSDGTPYTVFTPFRRNWQYLPLPPRSLPAPEHLPKPPAITSLEIPELSRQPGEGIFKAGEDEAKRKILRFTTSLISHYGTDRDRLDIEGTSGLSPYLRLGMLSARQAALAAREAVMLAGDLIARDGAGIWLNELAWREFYAAILYYFPHVQRTAFRAEMRQIRWREDETGFSAWAEGQTGFPVVDAGMRQLLATGWMHNRARDHGLLPGERPAGRLAQGRALLHAALDRWRPGSQ